MSKSYKPPVIEYIFDQLYDTETQTLTRTVVTSDDVQDAKRIVEQRLNLGIPLNSNPFNFMKDIVRGKSAEKLWPESVKLRGYIGQQRTGGGAVFEFVPFSSGQLSSLEVDFVPSQTTPEFAVQSLSLSQVSKSLGRRDEPWLLQVAVNLRILETHFAIGSNRQIDAVEMAHLQMDLKLRKVQIDALFLAHYTDPATSSTATAIITVEAKQRNQRILLEQIGRQVAAAFGSMKIDLVIPLAIATHNGRIHVVEFRAVPRSDLAAFVEPVYHRDALFRLEPPVPGI